MSSRVLKKLGLHGDSDIPKLDEESDVETDVSGLSNYNKEKYNRYDLLNDDTESESEIKEDDNETTESLNAKENIKEIKDIKRKKKKRKRRSTKTYYSTKSSEDVEDEIDRSVREVNELFGDEKENATENVCSNEYCLTEEMALLKVESRHLNPNNEFKRMFGSRVVNTSAEFKRKSRGRSVKSTVIVLQKETWLPITKQGISMKLVEKKNNCSYFCFEHSHSYQEIEKEFLTAVSSLTPDDIVEIINDYPYHVDALIQLSELCKIGEDHAMAAELIERAVFALEMAFHPSFNVCRGDCRLNYLRQENRSFYVAVLKHIQFVGQRACYRTALELSKMLLSLNPIEDPLAIILCLDYYALRAKEFTWFIQFTNAWNSKRNLLNLPNFKYSIALAHFYTNNVEEADICIKEALILFPSLLKPLTSKCNMQLDSKVATHTFFTSFAEATETKPLKCLIALYVERCQHIWKDYKILPWLEKNMNEVLARVEVQDPEITEYQTKRMTWFKSSLPVNIKRHLVIFDLTDILLLSGERMPNVSMHFDPYPPTNSINLYSIPRRSVISTSRRNNGILSSFIHSLNPNMNYELADETELGALGGEAGDVNQELRRSLRSIVYSIRGLLTSFETESGRRGSSRDGEVYLEGDAEDSETSESENTTH